MQPAFPLTRMVGGRYVSRYPGFWWADYIESIARSADATRRTRLEQLRARLIAQSVEEIVAVRPDIVIDSGTVPTQGQASVHDNPLVARMLETYRVLYRDPEVTVWLRSDIAPSSTVEPAPTR